MFYSHSSGKGFMNIIETSIVGFVIPSEAEGSLNKGQQSVLTCIQQNPGYNVPKISADTGIPSRSIERHRHIKALIEKSIITHQGSKKTGGYYAK